MAVGNPCCWNISFTAVTGVTLYIILRLIIIYVIKTINLFLTSSWMKKTKVKLHGLKYIGLLTCYNDIHNMKRIRKKE